MAPGSGGAFPVWQLITYSFLLTYLLSVAIAAMTQIAVSGYFHHAAGPVIGASGGVFGLLLAYAMYFPNRVISFIFLPFIQVRTRTFVLGYGAVELIPGVTNTATGVAHFAHLGGLFGEWLAVQYFRGRGLFGKR